MFSISPASLSLKPHMKKKEASRFSFVSIWKCAVPLFLFLHSICIPILDVCRSFADVRTQAIQSILWGDSWFRVLSPGWWVSPWEVQLLQSVNFPGLRLELHVFSLTVSSRQAKDGQKTICRARERQNGLGILLVCMLCLHFLFTCKKQRNPVSCHGSGNISGFTWHQLHNHYASV